MTLLYCSGPDTARGHSIYKYYNQGKCEGRCNRIIKQVSISPLDNEHYQMCMSTPGKTFLIDHIITECPSFSLRYDKTRRYIIFNWIRKHTIGYWKRHWKVYWWIRKNIIGNAPNV